MELNYFITGLREELRDPNDTKIVDKVSLIYRAMNSLRTVVNLRLPEFYSEIYEGSINSQTITLNFDSVKYVKLDSSKLLIKIPFTKISEDTGYPEYYTFKGRIIYFSPVPSSVYEVEIGYYRNPYRPSDLSADVDFPEIGTELLMTKSVAMAKRIVPGENFGLAETVFSQEKENFEISCGLRNQNSPTTIHRTEIDHNGYTYIE